MEALTQKITDFFRQNKFVVLLIAAGIGLMLLPAKQEETAAQPLSQPDMTEDCQESLEQILSQIHGVGKVRVLLTVSEGERTIYEYDENSSRDTDSSDVRREVVLISNSSRDEDGLVRQILGPVYRGAVVVCQGADLASVRLAVVKAVANATGLSTDKISVLKMK